MVPDCQGTNESVVGSNSCAGHSIVGNPTLVSSDHRHVGLPTNSSPKHPRSVDAISQLRLFGTGDSAPVGRLEGLRQHFRAKEIPSNAVDLVMSSWRSKTNSNYNSAWRKWEERCRQRGTQSFSADVSSILGSLADQFKDGKQYRSLNCYRSALSSTHLPVEGFPVGQHPLVLRLLKGGFNQRPLEPRYSHTWDVATMLTYLRSQGSNENLPLKLLTQKLSMLLALVLRHISSDLVRLSLCGCSYTPEGVVLPCTDLAKQTKPGNENSLQLVVIASFKDAVLCPVACLQAYEKATAAYRKEQSAMELFLAMVPPHQPVSSSPIARWKKSPWKRLGWNQYSLLIQLGQMNPQQQPLAGVSTQETMNRAGWSNKDTFCKFYYRPQCEFEAAKKFGRAVLSYKHAKDMLMEPEPPEV